VLDGVKKSQPLNPPGFLNNVSPLLNLFQSVYMGKLFANMLSNFVAMLLRRYYTPVCLFQRDFANFNLRLKTFQPLKLWKPVAKQNNTKHTKGHKTRLKNTTVRSFPVSESSEKYELRVSHFSPCSGLPSIPSQRVPFPFCMPTAINSTTCYSATSSILDFN